MLKKTLKVIYMVISCTVTGALWFLGLMETALGCPNIQPLVAAAILCVAAIMSINSYHVCVAIFDGNKKGR